MTDYQFPIDGLISLSCRLDAGTLTVLADSSRQQAEVSVTPRSPDSDVVGRSTIEMHGNTLVVHVPNERGHGRFRPRLGRPDRQDEVDLTISLPEDTTSEIRIGAGQLTMRGRHGTVDAICGSGNVTIDRVDDLQLVTGSGNLQLTEIAGAANVKGGSGQIQLGTTHGDLKVALGSGRLTLGVAHGRVSMRSGSGGAEIGSIEQDVDLASASGSMTIGVAPGVPARLNARTGSGRVHTEMPLEENPPANANNAIEVRARTGSGNITVRRAGVPVG